MKKFLNDLEKELRKQGVSESEITEILEDHKEMIESGKTEGLDEEKLNEKFGDPEQIAKDIYNDATETPKTMSFAEEVDSCTQSVSEEGYVLFNSFAANKIKNVQINVISSDLTISTYEGEEIIVLHDNADEIDKFDLSFSNETFVLKRKNTIMKNVFSFKSESINFIIKLPETGIISDYIVKTISGGMAINNIHSEELKVTSISGDIELSNVVTTNCKITTVSGDSSVNGLKANDIALSQVSGDASFENMKLENDFDINTVSGNVNVKNGYNNELSLRTVSGDFSGTECYPKVVSLKSVSGDITIDNSNKNHQISVKRKSTLSGTISI